MNDCPISREHGPTDADIERWTALETAKVITGALLDGDCETASFGPDGIGERVVAGVPDFDSAITVEARWRD